MSGAQVIVQGKRVATLRARDYAAMKPSLMPAVLESFERLKARCDLVLVEGAGSPAEVNLRAERHRQYGFCAQGRRSRRHRRRYRARRRHRPDGRHQGGDRSRGCRDDRRLHHQQIPRRPHAVRRRLQADRRTDVLARFWRSALLSPRAANFRRKMRWGFRTRASPASTRSHSWRCRESRISTISIH